MPRRNNRAVVTKRDVTHTAVAMEQLSKYVSAKTNTRNNRRAVFSAWSVPRGYKNGKEDRLKSPVRVGWAKLREVGGGRLLEDLSWVEIVHGSGASWLESEWIS
jgi:hypothetical protein